VNGKSMKRITATFDQDSKRYHRFIIDEGQGLVGNIYVPRGQDVPGEIVIALRTPSEGREG